MSMDDDDDTALARLLADPSLWHEPSGGVEDAVVTAIRAERAEGSTGASVVALRARRRWTSHAAAAVVGAAAAAAATVGVLRWTDDDVDEADESALAPVSIVELVGTDRAPGAVGSAEVVLEQSGTLIRLRMDGLPRREGGDFYEAWLKNCEGTLLVPIGTFHDLERAAGWAGVSVAEFPLLTVTEEQVAGPDDDAQGSSGEVVGAAQLGPCPDD